MLKLPHSHNCLPRSYSNNSKGISLKSRSIRLNIRGKKIKAKIHNKWKTALWQQEQKI
jgi:hypothetical protein